MDSTDLVLRGVHITLDALLKASGIAAGRHHHRAVEDGRGLNRDVRVANLELLEGEPSFCLLYTSDAADD